MKPKYKIGQVVKVFEYYAEGDIIKAVYYGLIVDVDSHCFSREYSPDSQHYIYHVLPNETANDRNGIQMAEEFAIEGIA